MSASPTQLTQSAKRPLEEASSPSRTTDQPDAKRPALDKSGKSDAEIEIAEPVADDASPTATEATNGAKSDETATAPSAEPAAIPAVPAAAAEPTANASVNDETAWIHIRSIISSPEAATIIGKGGENVSNIRKLSGAKCTVSDYQKGAVERILTVSGIVDAVAKVCPPPPWRWGRPARSC